MENTSLGDLIRQYDLVPDPEDSPSKSGGKQDIDLFEFMRATKAPTRDSARSMSAAGANRQMTFVALLGSL